MTADELATWQELERYQPLWDPWRAHGILCHVIAAAAGAKGLKPDDFIPKVVDRRRRSPAEMQTLIRAAMPTGIGRLGGE
jgi:hypothetical protein